MTPASRGLTWAFAAALAVAAPAAFAAFAADNNAAALSKIASQLPNGVTLRKANCDQTAAAIKQAVARDTEMASSILKAGILVRTPKQGQGELPCECLTKLTRAAIASDTKDANMLVELASSMRPDCADDLTSLLGANETDTANAYAFGVGFGPGFPGSPGFVGSPPSGSVALPPPSSTPVTTVVPG